ncbi:FUSC family protein [Inquilinus sp. OTU3971]|uniref:FUSC family protein n=1 Tax=Inquilinus sp. OTU3971 TaxID=3043855 RepID=UPI00313C6C31
MAPVSALITAKDGIGDTFAECRSRIVGTAIAILRQCLLSRFGLALAAQLAIIIAVTPVVVSRRPEWRVGLWTAAITLLSQLPGIGIWETGFARFCEVAIGSIAAIGVATLDLTAWGRWFKRRHSPRPTPAKAPDWSDGPAGDLFL